MAVAERTMAKTGGGQEIALPYMREMEHHFGCSFAHVKAFVDPAKAEAMNANAFAFGETITFKEATPPKDVVMHELTHVVQQTTGRAGSVAADEAEARGVQAGAKPAVLGAAGPATPEVRKDEAKPASGQALTPAKIKSAIAYNNSHWKNPHKGEIIAKLREGGEPGESFEEDDIVKVAALQKDAGVAEEGIDGKIGPSTMAYLLRTGLNLSKKKVTANQVRLVFFPGEFEDLAAWQKAREQVGKQGQEDEYRAMKNVPPGNGVIYVFVDGNIVDRMEARGGPPFTMKDGKDHTADPSKAGTYTLGKGKSHVTSSWMMSQIAWGAPIRKQGEDYQFKNPGEDWKTANGSKKQIKHEIPAQYFHENGDLSAPLVKEWRGNDFGETAFRVEGSPGLFIHTSPREEDQLTAMGPDLALTHSHGCLHVQPAKRNEMMEHGYLQKGVQLVIKKYTESLDPGATNKPKK